jgi:hypothetical protein
VEQSTSQSRIWVGTIVFAAFAVISLIVSIANGLVPIYLFECAGWIGLACYWQTKNTHSETAKAIVAFLAIAVSIAEVAQIAARADSSSRSKQSVTITNPIDAQSLPPVSPCPSGMPSGAKMTEIQPEQIEGSNGKLWYDAPDATLRENGGWFFHFSAINNTKTFCVTTIEYDLELRSDGGVILRGHGRKHMEPLSPGWSYTPQERDPDDEVTFAARPKKGELESWKITDVYGFAQKNN